MESILNYLKRQPKVKIAVIILLAVFLLNIFIKFVAGVYFPWNREDWVFYPYTNFNKDTELEGGKIRSYEGTSKVVVVPRRISTPDAVSGMDSTRVVAIEDFAFGYLSPRQEEAIEVIIVSEGIEIIEALAFVGCKNLKTIYLPMSIKKINSQSFKGITGANVITFNPKVIDALYKARNGDW